MNAQPDSRRFTESSTARMRRVVLGTAYALKPPRLKDLPGLWAVTARDLVARPTALPAPESARVVPDGLCGLAVDLSVPTLIQAYANGLYPFGHVGPPKWWSPAQRCVLFFNETHISKRLRAHLRQGRYRVTFDTAFDDVMEACAAPDTRRVPLTWITPRIMEAFAALHEAGHAHSFEVWNGNDELVGGGYGVASGGVFITESRFALEPNTSKIGFMVLNWHLQRWGFTLNDNKRPMPNVTDMGFREIPRAEYLRILLNSKPSAGGIGRWKIEGGSSEVGDWQPGTRAKMAPAA